jgi:uncharacterized protein YciI
MELEAYQLVHLRRPPTAPDLPEERLQSLQREHLAYYSALRAAGEVVTNGPVLNSPDPTLRGIAIFRTESEDRALQLAQSDPSVRAGRLSFDVMTWWTPPGTMTRPGSPISVEES